MEQTFVMIKPDGVKRGLIGKIITRIESRGLILKALQMTYITRERAETHYAEHKGKPFYERLIQYITSGSVVIMKVEGLNAINAIRQMVGATDPLIAAPGTIRADYALSIGENVIHASDSAESAEREINIFFD